MRKVTLFAVLLTMLQYTANAQIRDMAHAIAKAEGFGQRGTIPTRYHNPGDLKTIRGYRYPGQVGVGKGGHVIFRNDKAGWAALEHQIEKIEAGTSRYSVNMTLRELGKKYAGNWRVWSKNVAHSLGVEPQAYLWECLGTAPTLEKAWL